MGDWSIIVPEAATNLVTNPSCEKDTTGYTAVGSALAQETANQRRGGACLKVTPTASINDGVYYGLNLATNKPHTFSVDVLGYNLIPYRLFIFDVTAGAMLGSVYGFVGTGAWQRVSVTATTGANASCRLYTEKDSSPDTHAFYVDGLQCEQADHATTYIDGDQDGCSWTGPAHASTSVRSVQTRAGGREVFLDTATAGMVVSNDAGAGMPPVQLRTQARSVLPGSHYQGTTILDRVITLTITATGSSVQDLHKLRQTLIDLVKPDLTADSQPFLLRYRGAGKMLEIPVVYDTGLQGGDVRGMSETIALRLIAHDDPLWSEEGERASANLSSIVSATFGLCAGRVSGLWSGLQGGLRDGVGPVVLAIAEGPDKKIYFGGAFNQADVWGLSGIASPNLIRWNGTTWEQAPTPMVTGPNGTVRAILPMPDGTLIIAGDFTSFGGNANCRKIARYDPATNTVSALGTGMNSGATCNALALAPDGTLYAGGSWGGQFGGVANTAGIAKWNGSAWVALGTGVNGGDVYALAVGQGGVLYAGGVFTDASGVANTGGIAQWNGSAWAAMGTGISVVAQSVQAVTVDWNNNVYVGGNFASMSGVTGTAYLARWNPYTATWNPVGSGVNSIVRCIRVTSDHLLYIAGEFTQAFGNTVADKTVLWNGSVGSALDINLPGAAIVYGVCLTSKGDLYLGFDTAGTGTYSASTSILSAIVGSATTYPIIQVKRSGGTSATLRQITNVTTGKALLFNWPLADGETVTIDLRPGKRSIKSNVIGNAFSKVQANSDFGSFALAPGANTLTFYIPGAGSPTISGSVRWRVKHWATDGGA